MSDPATVSALQNFGSFVLASIACLAAAVLATTVYHVSAGKDYVLDALKKQCAL